MKRDRKRTRTTHLGRLGSGNVFADLAMPDPEGELLKAELVSKITEVIERRGITRFQACKIMALSQSKFSELCNGGTEAYSLGRLYGFLTRLGVGISVVLEDQPGWSRGRIEVVASGPVR